MKMGDFFRGYKNLLSKILFFVLSPAISQKFGQEPARSADIIIMFLLINSVTLSQHCSALAT